MRKKKAPMKKKVPPEIILNREDAKDILMNMLLDAASKNGGNDLDEAQELMYEAWETPQKQRRISLAKQALAISTDCADAFVLLGREDAKTPEEAIAYYREGVNAGERALGKKAFKEDVGYFWGLLETRPYMRARHHLALALWKAGAHEEAINHYQDMLRLNPGDNQGVRYLLLTNLLFMGKDKEAAKLHKAYDDGLADWAWSKLCCFFAPRATALNLAKRLPRPLNRTNMFRLICWAGRSSPKQRPVISVWVTRARPSPMLKTPLKHGRSRRDLLNGLKRPCARWLEPPQIKVLS